MPAVCGTNDDVERVGPMCDAPGHSISDWILNPLAKFTGGSPRTKNQKPLLPDLCDLVIFGGPFQDL